MRTKLRTAAIVAIGLPFTAVSVGAEPVGTAFTYQGQLKQNSKPVNGPCDFEFSLWDNALPGGSRIGDFLPRTVPEDQMVNGLFTVALDFGAGAAHATHVR